MKVWTCIWLHEPAFTLSSADRDSDLPAKKRREGRQQHTPKEKTKRKYTCSKPSAVCFLGEWRRPLKRSSLEKRWKKSGMLSVIKVSHGTCFPYIYYPKCIKAYNVVCSGKFAIWFTVSVNGHFCNGILIFLLKNLLRSWWCDICWGLCQTNMSSYI